MDVLWLGVQFRSAGLPRDSARDEGIWSRAAESSQSGGDGLRILGRVHGPDLPVFWVSFASFD